MTGIVCVSDVQMGYGSPQIPKLIESLCEHYDTKAVVINPLSEKKSKVNTISPKFIVKDIFVSDPYQPSGREEYVVKSADVVEELKPDILVICTTFCLPVLFKIKTRPKFVIYYYLETAMVYGQHDIELNRKIGTLVDFIIFTEENRAVKFGEVCGFQKIPFCIMYNCVNDTVDDSIIPSGNRNGKIIYQGTIREDTCADYYFHTRLQSVPIDIYGNIDGKEKGKYQKSLANLHEDIKYVGYIDSKKLSELRRHYIFSIVMWKPIHENNLYASPNKFFESISSGVPPITAPHPQCKMLVNRYSCGIVMKDWDFESFFDAIKLGLECYEDKNEYDKMVSHCLTAVKEELNWQSQMKKLTPHLKNI